MYFHDVFVSYSSNDRRWVESFVRDLSEKLAQRAGRRVPIWWDQQDLGPGDNWNEKMLADARRSRVFVPVVSPSWLNSSPCQRELKAFLKSALPGSLKPVIFLPVDLNAAPAQIKDNVYVEFHKLENGVAHELKGQLRGKALDLVAQAIAEYLLASSAPPQPKAGRTKSLSIMQSQMDIEDVVTSTRDRIAPDTLERCGWMRILNMSQRIDASEIYTEVNIFEQVRAKQRRSIEDIQKDVRPEDFNRETILKRVAAKKILNQHKRLMILGKPGSGKSTLLRRLAVENIRGQYHPRLVPAYIEFRALEGRSICEALAEQWATAPGPILRAGRALLLLDGLDELPIAQLSVIRHELDEILQEDKAREHWYRGTASIRNSLEPILPAASDSIIIVTCRIAAREYLSPLLNEIEIAEFNHEQISDFVTHWFSARGYSGKIAPFLTQMRERPRLSDLATSPLLLTMMCLYFEDHADLNVSRAELYSKGLDTILERWDASRGVKRDDSPYGRLSTRGRETLYSDIALRHLEKGEIIFPSPDIATYFQEPIDSASILLIMEAQHGLLIQRAQGIYSFSHLTFQEYLAAKSFAEDSDPARWDDLLQHVTDHRWREVFLLVTSMIKADYLVERMHSALNEFVAARPPLLELLRWVKRKQETFGNNYTSTAVRAFYFGLADRRAMALTRKFALPRDITDAVYSDNEFSFLLNKVEGYTPSSEVILALDNVLLLILTEAQDELYSVELYRRFEQTLILVREIAPSFSLAPEFLTELERLKNGPHNSEWPTRFQQVIIKYRDIGYEFFARREEDMGSLTLYEQGLDTILECLKSERVSPKTRASLYASMFAPPAIAPTPKSASRSVARSV